MTLLMDPDTILSSPLVTPYYHALEYRAIGDIVSITLLSIYFLGVAFKVFNAAMSKVWTRLVAFAGNRIKIISISISFFIISSL